ncbi:MAG: spiro-SPASM protein [Treponema sp.]|jgi:spiro-SPASM protein|nr:spiro-SPASM protein [Treponema sp.]
MNVVTVLYAGDLAPEAFEPVFAGRSAFSLCLERAAAFPGGGPVLLLAGEEPLPEPAGSSRVIRRPRWTAAELLALLSEESSGRDFAYYAWADAPFLDPALAGRVAGRHLRFAADYSYADGWPYGLAPELITPGAAGILSKIAGDAGEGPVKRDTLFGVLQRDINSFDIETEIAPVDLRYHRLSLTADSKRNLLLLTRFAGEEGKTDPEGTGSAEGIERIIAGRPELLRTLPAFFPIQVSGPCPEAAGAGAGSCGLCPYPRFGGGRTDFMEAADFDGILDKIEAFAGDAVIDLSLWGELALHPRREDLIAGTLRRPALSLVIETSGYGWTAAALESAAREAAAAPARRNGLAPLSWIISLGAAVLPGQAGGEPAALAETLVSLFPRHAGGEDRVYVEAVRTAGEEDAVERFYRAWKAFGSDHPGPGVIIQKYDSFCGLLPQKQAVDLSPVERRPCWHLMRDFPILMDGTVPLCREDLGPFPQAPGNIFREDPLAIWRRGEAAYLEQCAKNYRETCGACDEYYTFNF